MLRVAGELWLGPSRKPTADERCAISVPVRLCSSLEVDAVSGESLISFVPRSHRNVFDLRVATPTLMTYVLRNIFI